MWAVSSFERLKPRPSKLTRSPHPLPFPPPPSLPPPAQPVNAQVPSASNSWSNNLFVTRFPNFLARYPVPQTVQQV